jgi:light-independent protochlorophyllide reductase subunit B
MMGLEEHLIGMFRGDAEFHEDAAPSHLGGHANRPATAVDTPTITPPDNRESPPAAIPARWAPDAEKELGKIPFFVRGKARRNTERYAQLHSVQVVTIETLYDAKAHFSR